MKAGFVLIFAVFVCLILAAPAAAEEWAVPMNYTSGVTPIDVLFGTNASATDGFDANIDVPAPPDPPGGKKYCRFEIGDSFFPDLADDYRPELDATNNITVWDLNLESDESITLTWDSSEVPLTIASLTLSAAGDVDMLEESQLILSADTYAATITAEYDISPPVITNTSPSSDIFDTTVPTLVTISADFTDNVGVDPSSVQLLLNGTDVTSSATLNPENISYSFMAEEGFYTVDLSVSDYAGSSDQENWSFKVTEEIVVVIPLSQGWNMVSIPVEDPSLTLPAQIVTTAYLYNPLTQTYDDLNVNTLEPNNGYWVAATGNCNLTVRGVALENYTAELKRGWNMIGALYLSTSFTDPQTDPSGSVLHFVYGYNTDTQNYAMLTTLTPGDGYWAAATADCTLTVDLS